LAARVTDEDLFDHFRGEGKIKEARVVMDPRTKESRGFGFVDYAEAKDAESAVANLDRSVLRGRVIMVEKAKRTRPRTPTPGVYMSRGGREVIPTSRGPARYPLEPVYDRYYDRYERMYRRSPSPGPYRSSRRLRSPPPYRRRSPSPYPYRRRTPSPYYRRRRSISPY
jgi:transformer-2 protein